MHFQLKTRHILTSTLLYSICLYIEPTNAFADVITTVSPQNINNLAKPLEVVAFDKSKIWLLFTAGAAVLFLTAVLLENIEPLFPSIYRSNQVMKAARKREKQLLKQDLTKPALPRPSDDDDNDDNNDISAVVEGIREARKMKDYDIDLSNSIFRSDVKLEDFRNDKSFISMVLDFWKH